MSISASKLAKLAERRARRGLLPARDSDLPIVPKRSSLCRRLRLRVAFCGSAFHGWSYQPNLRTLQSELESAVRSVLQQRVRLVPAGRTDSGVHALAQICQFDAVLGALEGEPLVDLFNDRLSQDIRILDCTVASPDFNVMVTRWKRYVYRVPTVGLAADTLEDFCKRVTQCPEGSSRALDTSRMRAAASLLIGTHDFAGFQTRGGRQSTERTLYACTILEAQDALAIVMEADGFLMHMCRILAGTLVKIGCGLSQPEDVLQVFQSGDRGQAGPTLPAAGLCLEHVEHERDWSQFLSDSIPVDIPWPNLPGK
eukprot:TRINITY_DN5076_c1_g1_i1.p1 TRINITY_DN5076_c1_g1~~TRINITY_DN5076_c1_g1_i1.p1  ORF type:complete len:312 (-),score=37.43 TRINITY_DN5076_c1_g1_i1:90-1025(-)